MTYELAVALVLGWTPPSLAPFTLWTSWTNKVRREADKGWGGGVHVVRGLLL